VKSEAKEFVHSLGWSVELHNGLFAVEADAAAGELQLRAQVNDGTLDLLRGKFRDAFPLREDESYRQQRQGRTGKLTARTLRDRELSYPAPLSRLAGFAQRFFVLDETFTNGKMA
jgi:hypothetical protein